MRRKEREITDINELLDIVSECKVCRIGMYDESGVYIVPLNFCHEYKDSTLNLYFHGAKEGRKITLMKLNPHVGFEMDCNHSLVRAKKACDYSYTYKSIVGKGVVRFIEDIEEKRHAFSLMMKQIANEDVSFSPQVVANVCLYKIVVSEFSGKVHL